MKGRTLQAFLVGRDGPTSIFEARRPLVDLLVVTIAHPDDRGARSLLHVSDVHEGLEERSCFSPGPVHIKQVSANHIVHSSSTIIDVEEIPRHRPSEPARTGLMHARYADNREWFREGGLRLAHGTGRGSSDRDLSWARDGRGHLSQPSGNGWLDKDTGRLKQGFKLAGRLDEALVALEQAEARVADRRK